MYPRRTETIPLLFVRFPWGLKQKTRAPCGTRVRLMVALPDSTWNQLIVWLKDLQSLKDAGIFESKQAPNSPNPTSPRLVEHLGLGPNTD